MSTIQKYIKLEKTVKENLDECVLDGATGFIWVGDKFGFGFEYQKSSLTGYPELILTIRRSSANSKEFLEFPMSLVDAMYLRTRHFLLQWTVKRHQSLDDKSKQELKRQKEYDQHIKMCEKKFDKYFSDIR